MTDTIKKFLVNLRDAMTPGIATAVVSLPLSIGFALIAGVPPETMIVASIYAAVFNAVFANSRYGVGGPNTAVALLTGAAIAPFAPAESHLYMGYVFSLCVMVSIFQLMLSVMLRYIDLMDYVSKTVIDGLTVGIGAVFVLSSLNMAIGLSPNTGQQWSVFNAFATFVTTLEGDANTTAMIISVVALLTGIICWQFRHTTRFAIVIAVSVATLFSIGIESMTDTPVEHIGWLSPTLLSPSIPDFRTVSWSTLFNLTGPAAAIAIIGALQTLSIAKGVRRLGEPYTPHREMLSQGLQHLFMGFFSGAPVSNSYNKSILMYSVHGSKLAQIVSAIVTAGVIIMAGSIIMYVPMPALGACLILVGISMLNLKKHRPHLTNGWHRWAVFGVSAAMAVILSIHAAILIGTVMSIILHVVKLSKPSFDVVREGDEVILKLTSPLFFASGSRLNRYVDKIIDFDDQRIRYATIDLTEAYLLTDDHIDVDWLHRLFDANIRVRLVVSSRQRKAIDTMLARGIIPAECSIRYLNDPDATAAMIKCSSCNTPIPRHGLTLKDKNRELPLH